VVKRESLGLSEAVRKMTAFAADTLGITDRGRVEVGQAADLIVFDPAEVRANATYPEPHQLASGFDLVLVNGEIAFQNGAGQPQRNGKVLRP